MNTPLTDFYDMLEHFDWHYEMSDDHRVWSAGKRQYDKLTSIAKQSYEHQNIWDDYVKHIFSGSPWGTDKQPKPTRPN